MCRAKFRASTSADHSQHSEDRDEQHADILAIWQRQGKAAVEGGSVKGVCPVWASSLMDVDRENNQLGLEWLGEQGRGDHTEARRKEVKMPDNYHSHEPDSKLPHAVIPPCNGAVENQTIERNSDPKTRSRSTRGRARRHQVAWEQAAVYAGSTPVARKGPERV